MDPDCLFVTTVLFSEKNNNTQLNKHIKVVYIQANIGSLITASTGQVSYMQIHIELFFFLKKLLCI